MLRVIFTALCSLSLAGTPARVEAADVAHAFEPLSHTAVAITGPIILSDRKVVFASGASADLEKTGAPVRADWDLTDRQIEGQVYRMSRDPGPLEQSNKLCGQNSATHLVTWQLPSGGRGMSVFSSEAAPTSGQAPGLCGTFSYAAPASMAAADHDTEAGSPASGGVAGSPGKWITRNDVNPLDDSRTVLLMLNAESGNSRFGKTVTLYARCQSNVTEVYVNWNDYLGDDSGSRSNLKNVTSRIGDNPASLGRWGISTDNAATFYPRSPVSFLKSMLDQERLVLQTTPYNESPITAVFDIRGLRNVLGGLASTCGWSF
ncbi:type VI secretion protein [Cereibacter sphaeroides]|uniref:type VI secretion system-associated protein TagO n=1 Tax=Cereibacter sphaeroides TaxID=1063 RepID=UPI001F362EB2|nr:type VI secretion system-associated protein TagO [Cereibacter sphaeroides]MCE6958080.1 type VI secretion protein [Cereibacter sphaeroides]MCE6971433.1 type VI secretion protein [Cereibacter sphaeroides]